MYAYLLKYGVCGIKNIKENVELSFYKKGVDKNFDPSDYRIKSIYGENGSGKTAIVTSFSIFKKLILDSDYLSDHKTQDLLHHIVNKEKKEFKIYSEFYININENSYVYYYEISVGLNDDSGFFEIKHEELKRKRATYTSAVYKELFEVKDGQFITLIANDDEKEISINRTMNLLKRSSAIIKLFEVILDQFIDKKISDFSMDVIIINLTASSIHAFLNKDDEHSLFYAKKKLEKLASVKEFTDEHFEKTLHQMNEIISLQNNYVLREFIGSYEKKIKGLTDFIQIFKPSLKTIHVEKKDIDPRLYEVSLVFNYDSYCVDYEFESTGIKKMVQLYEAIWAVARGDIVFIDEFDANINSIFFDRLIEYVRDYSKGQLCFTVHNTSSMDSLKDGKDSINFLTNDNQIVKWTKNSHYSPDILYRNGMIDKMPFNIYGSDFVSIFEDDYE